MSLTVRYIPPECAEPQSAFPATVSLLEQEHDLITAHRLATGMSQQRYSLDSAVTGHAAAEQ